MGGVAVCFIVRGRVVNGLSEMADFDVVDGITGAVRDFLATTAREPEYDPSEVEVRVHPANDCDGIEVGDNISLGYALFGCNLKDSDFEEMSAEEVDKINRLGL